MTMEFSFVATRTVAKRHVCVCAPLICKFRRHKICPIYRTTHNKLTASSGDERSSRQPCVTHSYTINSFTANAHEQSPKKDEGNEMAMEFSFVATNGYQDNHV